MQDIIVSDHVIAPTTPASRTSPSSPFQRFTNSIRKSFNRIRTSQRRKPVKTRRNLAEKDGAISDDYDEISGRNIKSVDIDCESVDSGLETDQSSDLTPSSKTTEYNTKSCLRKDTSSSCNSNNAFTSSNRSSSYYQDSLLSTTSSNIDRKSSARSNHTIDSGILVNSQKRSPPSRNLRREEILPKKRVSILLPERPKVQHAKFVRSPGENNTRSSRLCSPSHGETLGCRDIGVTVGSRQVEPVVETDVIAEAMHELMSVNSQYCDIIFLMFIPRPNLKALTEDDISRILFGLYSILKGEELPYLHFFEISVWMLQRFVFKVSRLLETRPGVCHQPPAWESLIRRSEIMKYSRHSSILEDTRSLYLELWCSLLEA